MNFLNVGHFYGSKVVQQVCTTVLQKKVRQVMKLEQPEMFQWEGVRPTTPSLQL